MTRQQVFKAATNHKYLLLRLYSGEKLGINCKVLSCKLNQQRINQEPDKETPFTGFIPCNFDQYISYKIPYLWD